MPKIIKKRIQKKTTDTEVEVKERLSSLRDTLKERQKTALQYGIVILLILAAFVGFFIYSSASKKKAQDIAYEGYKVYTSAAQAQTSNKDEQYQKALELFNKAADTRKTPFSLFYIAACYYELGKQDEALKALKDFARTYADDDRYAPLAYQKMALIYARQGNNNEARAALDSLSGLKGDIFKDFALLEYGKLLEKEGKSDEAKKKFKELVQRFPNSPFKDEATAKLLGKKQG
jgi:predicted negative regulator of RcsB-dependent stress response